VSLIPGIGIGAATLLVPGFSVGFMAAGRAAERGRPVELGGLFAGFRGNAVAQLQLGAIYVASLAALLGATMLADGGALAQWLLQGREPDDEMLQSGEFLAALGVAAALYVPVMMLYWFAPVLAAWHGMRAPQALFYSFFASLLNWRAFLAYGAATALLTLALPLAVVLALAAAAGGGHSRALPLVFPLLVLLLPILFGSFYASYRDIFPPAEGPVPLEADNMRP
jgi:hypothetical protein